MEATGATTRDPAADRLAGELADTEASIELVSTGVASSVTLTGLRFGRQVANRLTAVAARRGVQLEASFWPEDEVCDIRVGRTTIGRPAAGSDAGDRG